MDGNALQSHEIEYLEALRKAVLQIQDMCQICEMDLEVCAELVAFIDQKLAQQALDPQSPVDTQ